MFIILFYVENLIVRLKQEIAKENYQDRTDELFKKVARANDQTGSSTFIISALANEKEVMNVSYIGDSCR